MKKIFILAIILLSGTAAASAQEFLTINPDVRTAGMANASVATTGGAYSVFQNAASSLFSPVSYTHLTLPTNSRV